MRTSGKGSKLTSISWRGERLGYVYLYSLFLSTPILTTAIQIHFFAHLVIAKLVSAESMFALLQSFTAVLDEFGVSHGRAKRAALCAGEGLMIVCYVYLFIWFVV